MSSLSDQLAKKREKLIPTQTVVRQIWTGTQIVGSGNERPDDNRCDQVVLILSKNWLVYKWIEPKIKKNSCYF